MFNTKLKRELQQLRDEFEQYKYDQSNLPKYKVGQVLEDKTIITKVERIDLPRSTYLLPLYRSIRFVGVQKYTWCYKGVCKGKIVVIKA
jgi:hypothetical protein